MEGLQFDIPTIHLILTAVNEKELEVPAKELEKYFFSLSTDQAPLPINQYL